VDKIGQSYPSSLFFRIKLVNFYNRLVGNIFLVTFGESWAMAIFITTFQYLKMIKILILFLFLQVLLFGQYGNKTDSLISLIVKSNPGNTSDIEEVLIKIMYISIYDSAKTLSDKLLKVTPDLKNKSLYIKTLIHSYRFYPFDEKIKMLNEASELALRDENNYLLNASYVFKAIAFRDNSMADSALIFAMKSRDLSLQYGNVEDVSGALQLIADVHYYAGEYEDAEIIYKQILHQENYQNSNWRFKIIQNNLGLIKIKERKFDEAENYFLNSLNRYSNSKMSYADSSGLPYIYRKLLEVSLLQKKYDKANEYYNIGKPLTEKLKQTIELSGYYIGKAEILYQNGKYDSSLIYLKRAEELEKSYPDLKFKIDLYTNYSNVYGELGKYADANKYLLLLLNSTREADSLFNRSRLMHTFAEHNYETAAKQRDNYLRERNLYIAILILAAISLLVIIIFFIRLRNSYKILIGKNVQLALSPNIESFSHISDDEQNTFNDNELEKIDIPEIEKKRRDIDNEKIDEIIGKLEIMMTEDKVYLEPDLSLISLAQKLKTNRTYLLTAIQKKYDKNFLNFINDYRIKEAIKIISSDEVKNLNMAGIANKAGFNNRVTFTKIFKQATGVSPSFFINNIEASRAEAGIH
jgi:AraC-like DNA-binding protein